jgi:hypothetical protein
MWKSLSGRVNRRKLHWWYKGRMFVVSQCGLIVAKYNLKEGDYPKCKHCERAHEKIKEVKRLRKVFK